MNLAKGYDVDLAAFAAKNSAQSINTELAFESDMSIIPLSKPMKNEYLGINHGKRVIGYIKASASKKLLES